MRPRRGPAGHRPSSWAVMLALVLALAPTASLAPRVAASTCDPNDLICGIAPLPEAALNWSACAQAAVAMLLEGYGPVPGSTAREKIRAVEEFVPQPKDALGNPKVTQMQPLLGVTAAASAFGLPITGAAWKSVAAGTWVDDLRAIVVDGRRPVIALLPDLQPIWPKNKPVGHYVVVSGVTPDGSVIEHDPYDGAVHEIENATFERAWGGETAIGVRFARGFQYLDVTASTYPVAGHLPGGTWASPADGAAVSGRFRVAVHAFPTQVGDPAIDHVVVTAWWSALGDRSGPWRTACSVTPPTSSDMYECLVDPVGLGAPPGALAISFDVTDRSGVVNFAPSGERSVRWSATATPPTASSQAATPSEDGSAEFSVNGSHPRWTETGFLVHTGDQLHFRATGEVFWDPAVPEPNVGPGGASWTPSGVSNPSQFLLPNVAIASLIGKIGEWVFPIGSDHVLIVPSSGLLSLGMNERWVDGSWDDNSGSWQVSVQIERP